MIINLIYYQYQTVVSLTGSLFHGIHSRSFMLSTLK